MTQLLRRRSSINLRKLAVLPAVALLLTANGVLANPAHGQDDGVSERGEPPPRSNRGARSFERWDQDHDGRITIAALPSRIQAHLATLDQNRDGILVRDEFDKGRERLRQLREKDLDKNGDGRVTEEERRDGMRARVVERFVERDENHDGVLVESEVAKRAWERMKSADANSDSKLTLDELKTAFDEGKLDPPHTVGIPNSEAEFKARARERFNSEDKNRDGFLTASEVPKQKWERFKSADSNHDSRVTFDELTTAFKSGALRHPDRPHGRRQDRVSHPAPNH